MIIYARNNNNNNNKFEALELLEAMGITNPYGGQPYDGSTLDRMVQNRLWGSTGKSWTDMKEIFLEPIIETLIRQGTMEKRINKLLGRGNAWTSRYIKRKWNFNSFQEAVNFFKTHYIGLHEANNYLD